jgi:hypothetical protein
VRIAGSIGVNDGPIRFEDLVPVDVAAEGPFIDAIP